MQPVIKSTYEDFAENTSIHGFKNTIRSRTSIIWGIIILTAVLFSTYISLLVWFRYISNPTLTRIQTDFATINDLAFPAITICSNNQIIGTKVDNFINTLELKDNISSEHVKEALPIIIVLSNTKYLNKFNVSQDLVWLKNLLENHSYTELDVFKRISINCNELLIKCKWEEREFNCSQMFAETFSEQGRCCSFNYDLTHSKQPIFTKYFGQYMGLKVIANNSDDDQLYGLIRAKGITVSIHDNDEYPLNAVIYRVISPNYITYFQLSGTKIVDSDEVKMLLADQRECVYEHEIKLKYFKGYSDDNCLADCIIKNLMKICNCVPFMYLFTGENLCGLDKLECLIEFDRLRPKLIEACHCPYQCQDINYRLLSSGSNLVHSQYSTSSLLENVNTSEVTMVNIYFSKDVYRILRRDIVTGSIYLMSSLGGTFSLFLGCSFTSVIEILYYLCIRFLINLKILNKIEHSGKQFEARRLVSIPLVVSKKPKFYYDNNAFYN